MALAAVLSNAISCRVSYEFNHCRCQTYEGGISAVPGTEAHGGYAFCGLAALYLLEDLSSFDLAALEVRTEWLLLSCRCYLRRVYFIGFISRPIPSFYVRLGWL